MQWLMTFDAANLVILYLLGVKFIGGGTILRTLAFGGATVINGEFRSLFLSPHAARSPSLMYAISADLRGDVNRRGW